METFWPKEELPIFFQLESIVDKQLLIPPHYSICLTKCLSMLYLYPLILTKSEWDRERIIQLLKKSSNRENN